MTRRVVYLVRHGEAGGAEPGAVLTDAGRRQAALLAERLAQIPFAAIHHSPWDRAAQSVLVTHANVVNWFVSQALDAPDWAWLRMLDYNAALTVILYLPDRVKLVAYNDTGHLPPDLRGTGYPQEARI